MAISNGGAEGKGQPQLATPLVTPATPQFKLVLLLIFSLTVAAMVASYSLAILGPE